MPPTSEPQSHLDPSHGSPSGRSSRARVVVVAALLALVPLCLATWAFGRSFRASELARQDATLQAALPVLANRVAAEASTALRDAQSLADDPRVQRARQRHDRRALRAFTTRRARVALEVVSARSVPAPPTRPQIVRVVSIAGSQGVIGRVVARVAIDAPFLAEMGRETGTMVVVARHNRVLEGTLRGATVGGVSSRPHAVRAGGRAYRALGIAFGAGGDTSLVALARAPDAWTWRRRQLETFGAGAATIALIAFAVLYLFPLRRPHVRIGHKVRRDPLALVGEAFAAGHDPQALLLVILETMVGATGAAGGRLLAGERIVAELGETEPEGRPLTVPFQDVDSHVLVLQPPPRGFTTRERALASSLVAQGRVALENAQLHTVVRRQAVTDELTDLPNRRQFMQALHQEVARSERFETPLSLVLFDLDDFKQINDRHGHQVGDRVLQATALAVSDRVRETDLPARLGGEEFAILLPGTDVAGAAALAEHLRQDLARLTVSDVDSGVTASFGVSGHRAGLSETDLLGIADRALYRAKAAGKNRVAVEDDR